MAITVSVVLATVQASSTDNYAIQVPEAIVPAAQELKLTDEAQVTQLIANLKEYWIITVSGGNVWAHFWDPDKTLPVEGEEALPMELAAPGKDWLIVDGTTREFSVGSICRASFMPA